MGKHLLTILNCRYVKNSILALYLTKKECCDTFISFKQEECFNL